MLLIKIPLATRRLNLKIRASYIDILTSLTIKFTHSRPRKFLNDKESILCRTISIQNNLTIGSVSVATLMTH